LFFISISSLFLNVFSIANNFLYRLRTLFA
jgi:hypothetical protein